MNAAAFLDQLYWELYRLWARPRAYLGFGLCVLFDLGVSGLLHLPGVKAAMARDIWRSIHVLGGSAFAGPSIAVHTLGESITMVGTLALALVGGDLMAKEREEGLLRMILCRPVSRSALYFQKLVVAAVYAAVLTAFASLSALTIGLIFEGPGPLILSAPHEGIIGTFDFASGMHRYLMATLLLMVSSFSGILIALTAGCFNMKPAVAATIALTFFFTDDIIRTQPSFASVSPYCYTTRVITWRQAFNNEVSWIKVRRNYEQLLWIDLGLIAVGWTAFCRPRPRLH